MRTLFVGHEVKLAIEMGWEKVENGRLLILAATEKFELVVTVDRKMRHEQNLEKLPVSVLELADTDTRIDSLRDFAPHLPAAIEHSSRYRFVSVRKDGRVDLLGERALRGSRE
jgi:hypothetical protein